LLVDLTINDYKKLQTNCRKLQFFVPGPALNPVMRLPATQRPWSTREPISTVRSDDLGNQIIEIDRDRQKEFFGTVEFFWPSGIFAKSFAEKRVIMPFNAVETPAHPTFANAAKSFQVSLPVRSGQFTLKEKSHELVTRQAVADLTFYGLKVDR